MDRVVGHIDLDYFFAQVEEVENPALKGKPVVVCVFSGRTEDSGVVSTANYQARGLGVRSGMPIVAAKKKLKGTDAVLIRLERGKYDGISEKVMEIVRERVDALEQTGVDEAFFDLTRTSGGDFEAARVAAGGIQKSILDSVHLTCSLGVGRSKVVAKVCSDLAKPGGIKVVLPDSTEDFLGAMQVDRLYGVGPKTTQVLESIGVRSVRELANASFPDLERHLGRKLALYLHDAARGSDSDPVSPGREATQLSRIVTLKGDTKDPEEALAQLGDSLLDIRGRLVARNETFRTISAIGILTDLSVRTKSKTFETPIDDLQTMKSTSLALFKELSGTVAKEFRRVGVRVSDLTSREDQRSLAEFLQST